MKLVEKVSFKKTKAMNCKSLSEVKKQNMDEMLDKIDDISACICTLPVRSCDQNAVKYKKEKSARDFPVRR